ncbi:pilus assembly protein [Yersinia artesiana]|uniref:pilus assembly protein n=1 Tax=Yersinia artesiana TaxID=2890315 RepID=UPI001582B656|nr:pilus assembly protein [Yersinia artesiana]
MMNLMTKGYVATQVNVQEFLKNNRGSIIEYVMVIALAGVLIAAAKKPLTDMTEKLVTDTQTAVLTPAK